MKIFEIKINNNKTTHTVDTNDYDNLTRYYDEETTNVEILKAYEYVPQEFSEYVNNKCTLATLLFFVEYYAEFEEDLEQYYNDLESQEEIPFLYELIDFSEPEDFFNTYFESPHEAACATQFGNVHWFDNYIYFNGYGNLETLYEIPYDDYKDEIMEQWFNENFEREVQK